MMLCIGSILIAVNKLSQIAGFLKKHFNLQCRDWMSPICNARTITCIEQYRESKKNREEKGRKLKKLNFKIIIIFKNPASTA